MVSTEEDPDAIYREFELPFPVFPDPMVSIFVGETIQNLRSSLDYLVYALAWSDSGSFQEKTQFPMDSSPKTFEKRRSGKLDGLAGLNAKHIARIERLQPYKGCEWTRVLRELSNHDKHRTLIKISANGKFTVKVIQIGDATTKPIYALADRGMNMKSTISGPITFANGPPVIDTLEELQTQVTNLLCEFDPFFIAYAESKPEQ